MKRQANGRGPAVWAVVGVCCVLLVLPAAHARAAAREGDTLADQARTGRAQHGRLVVVAADSLGGRLPGATVLVSREGAPPAGEPLVLVTDASGETLAEGLDPGAYVVTVEMPGFDPTRLEIVVTPGETRRLEATLAIQAFAEEVAVVQETERARDTDGFSEVLTIEDISQLPDDPDDMAQMLDELAGGDAEFRVNGFEGGECLRGTRSRRSASGKTRSAPTR
jgi:hypothetical protein